MFGKKSCVGTYLKCLTVATPLSYIVEINFIGGGNQNTCRKIIELAKSKWWYAPIVYSDKTINILSCKILAIKQQYKVMWLGLFLVLTRGSHVLNTASILLTFRGRRGRDHMVVGFTTTYAIGAYHHWCREFEFRWGRGVHHYVIKFVSDLWQVSGFLRFPPPLKLIATI